jgi:hypothetical protein
VAPTGGGRNHGKTILPRLRYLWWPEFQRRGALHYHLILVDPPFELERDARHWFDQHWPLGKGHDPGAIQAWVEFRSAAWFRSAGGNYVLKDARKVAGKWYEQDYLRMPKGWRTFRHHYLTFPAAEHQEHENKAWTVCTARPGAPWYERQLDVWVERVDWHVPGRTGCKLSRRRRPFLSSAKQCLTQGDTLGEFQAQSPTRLGELRKFSAAKVPALGEQKPGPGDTLGRELEQMHDTTPHENAADTTRGASKQLSLMGGKPYQEVAYG